MIKVWGILGWLLVNSPAVAGNLEHPCAVGEEISGVIQVGERPELFKLQSHAEKFGLAGIYSPAPSSFAGFVTLYMSQPEVDRYGRWLVQGFQKGKWIQGRMLRQGKALAFGLAQPEQCIVAMRAEEKLARVAGRGVWAKGEEIYQSDNLELLQQKIGHFLVVEGRVLSVGDRPRRIYLNFGQNWSQDFTVSVVKKGKDAFKGDMSALLGLKGRTVQVRGVLEMQKGPLMRVIDKAQIEIID